MNIVKKLILVVLLCGTALPLGAMERSGSGEDLAGSILDSLPEEMIYSCLFLVPSIRFLGRAAVTCRRFNVHVQAIQKLYKKLSLPLLPVPREFFPCHHLIKVDIEDPMVTDECLGSLARACSNLQHVNVVASNNITDVGVVNLVLACKENLQHVDFSRCGSVTDLGLAALASCPHLQSARMESTQVSDSGLIILVSACHGLLSVNFSGCENITDAGVIALASACQNLRSINVFRTGVIDAGLAYMRAHYPGIKVIN